MKGDGNSPTRPVTSADVARAAGVSRATVSVALSGREGSTRLGPETRARIQEIARELGYTPHPAAVALRNRRTMRIVFVARPARTEPHEQAIPYVLTTTASRILSAHGYTTLVVQPEPLGNPRQLIDLILSNRAEGVLWDSPRAADQVEAIVDAGVPCVMLMRPLSRVAGTTGAVVDPRPGVRAAIRHLARLGHRRVAFIAQRGPHEVDLGRIDAFDEAVRAASIASDATVHLVDDYSIAAGYAATADCLADGTTAVITSSDGLTLGVLRHLYDRRLRVPEAMSVVSFDDAAVAHLYPPVTSISQPFGAIAEQAVASLLDTLAGQRSPARVSLPTGLMVRGSTGPAAAMAAGR